MPEAMLSRRARLAEGTALLREAGVADPRREALRLWSEGPGGDDGADTILAPDAAAEPGRAAWFLAAVRRRAAGEPLAHVTGRTGFRHLLLRSDRRALIPRPETEGLVDLLLARVRTGRVGDVGTGTGCLALSLAAEASFDRVVATELSPDALDLARENVALNGGGVDLVSGDLCRPFAEGALDALVSNPPYLTTAEHAGLDRAVRDWEPAAALVSGADGLASTFALLDDARRVVRPGGWIALEVDCSRAARCAARAAELGWSDVAVQHDLFGRERYLLARRSLAS